MRLLDQNNKPKASILFGSIGRVLQVSVLEEQLYSTGRLADMNWVMVSDRLSTLFKWLWLHLAVEVVSLRPKVLRLVLARNALIVFVE